MAGTENDSAAPPVLVNNVETIANVPAIIAKGADWFRSIGTADSPGTILCTVTGAVQHPGVFEVAMGTPLRQVIDSAGGIQPGRHLRAVMVGVSSAVLTAEHLDTALSYEAMAAVGSGLGSAGFIVIADETNAISLAAGASRFLAIESCGQCTPCKQDGLEIARLLEGAAEGTGTPDDLATIRERLATVVDGARCSLASQHQSVIGSMLRAFDPEIRAGFEPNVPAVGVHVISALVDIDDEGARYDTSFVDKQPDWTFDEVDSGKTPVERFTDHREADDS
jgi:NADH:ubiquinone oxidoreductase subunit F (NADH-binding)